MAFFRRTSLGPLAVAMALVAAPGVRSRRAAFRPPTTCAASSTCSRRSSTWSRTTTSTVPDNEKLIKGAIDGMLEDPRSAHRLHARAARPADGRGVPRRVLGHRHPVRDPRRQAIVVISPLEGTPAYRLGIRAGDRIVEIDGKPLPKTLTNDDVFKLLRGPRARWSTSRSSARTSPSRLKFDDRARQDPDREHSVRLHDPSRHRLRPHHPLLPDHRRGARARR